MSGKRSRLPADTHHVTVGIQAHRTRLEDVGRRAGLLPAAQDSPQPGYQFATAEGLGDVVIGAELEPDDLVHLAVLRGEHHDRDVGAPPQLATDLESGKAGQHQVEQDDVGTGAVEFLKRRRAGRRDRDLEALLAKQEGKRVGERVLVLDDQHPGHWATRVGDGSSRVNVEPEPGELHTRTCPPWLLTMCLTMARPRPVPPVWRERAGSTR